MLILYAFANDDPIDVIAIQNDGLHVGEFWRYKIRKPEGHDGPTFLHRRSSGWRPLAEKVLHYLNQADPVIDVKTIKNKKRFKQAAENMFIARMTEKIRAYLDAEDYKWLYGDPKAKKRKMGIIKYAEHAKPIKLKKQS